MGHHRHKKAEMGVGSVNLGLIITPMLDMAFQILAFFIMTYHPSALEGHIPGSLVPPENFAKKGKDNSPAADPLETPLSVPEEDLLPELQEAIQVQIKAIAKGQEIGSRVEGQPLQLKIKLAQDTQHRVLADVEIDFDVALKRLERELRDLVKKGATTKANVKLEADGNLRQQYIMATYDACKRAGFDKIHFVPPPILSTKLK